MSGHRYQTLDFTEGFLDSYISRDFTAGDRRLIKKALRFLDENEKHPSLRVHALERDLVGVWSASASGDLRITFERHPGARKRLLTCTRHYGD